MRRIVLAALLAVQATCADDEPSSLGTGRSWPEADALFHQEPRWLGADAAYSCALGDGRVLWLFGDSFVATSPARVRTESTMVRNSVAVQSSPDPLTASMTFAWQGTAAAPTSYFPERDAEWHWPGGCVRLAGGPLVVFLFVVRATDTGLGFAGAGFRVAFVDDPSGSPAAWSPVVVDPPARLASANAGTAVALDGSWVYVLDAEGDAHAGQLLRISTADLAARNLDALAWWTGSDFSTTAAPATMLDDAGSEASLHRDGARWLHVASRGFGASTIAMRQAPSPTGPWSPASDVFTPPESMQPDPFVYAGKAHPELATGDGTLAVTYATNRFDFAAVVSPAGQADRYWPRFVKVTLAR